MAIHKLTGGRTKTAGTLHEETRTVVLTHAQILALRASPATLVPAAGPGTYIELVGAALLLQNTNAYTEVTYNLAIRQNNGTGVIVSQTIETTGWVDGVGTRVTNALPKIDTILLAANVPLVLHNTGAAEFGAGNAANTLAVQVRYRVYRFP
jgi:hypothetical protein